MLPDAAWRVARAVARHLALGDVLSLEATTAGLLNRGLVATTATGRWFLKGSRYPDPDVVVREHEVAAVARRAGVPSPTPACGRDGTTVTWAGNRWWATFPFVDGRHVAPVEAVEDVAEVLGATLGRIHAALDEAPPDLVRRLPVKGAPDGAETLARIRGFEEDIARRPARTAFDAHALASLAYRRSIIEAEATDPWPGADLPTGATHGDFQAANVLFDAAMPGASSAVVAVLDWELAAVAPRALDVARALDLAIDLRADLAAGGARLRAFAAGYGRHATLGRDAATRLPDLYRTARAHSLWVYEEHYRRGEAPTDAVAIDDLATLEWWHRDRGDIRAAVSDAFADLPRRVLASSRTAGTRARPSPTAGSA